MKITISMCFVETAFNIQVPEATVHTAVLQSEQDFSCTSGMMLLGSLPPSSRAVYRASKGKGSKETGTGAWGCEEQVESRNKGKEETEE